MIKVSEFIFKKIAYQLRFERLAKKSNFRQLPSINSQ